MRHGDQRLAEGASEDGEESVPQVVSAPAWGPGAGALDKFLNFADY